MSEKKNIVRIYGRVRVGKRASCCLVAVALSAFFWEGVSIAAAGGEGLDFHISPQALSSALEEYADQANVQMFYEKDIVAGHGVAGVYGHYLREDALASLLAGTGLDFEFATDNTVVVRNTPAQAVPETGSGQSGGGSAKGQRRNNDKTNFGPTNDSSERVEPGKESSRTPTALEEIVVTAQRRAESFQKVPASIVAFGAEAIRKERILGLDDVAAKVPGLTIGNFSPEAPNITLRGIGSTDRDVGSDRSVVVFIDEVAVGRAGASTFDLFDLERIEVLRGPQGTLYGKNVVGGAISYITKKPEPGTDAYLMVGFGDEHLFESRGMFNSELSDAVQMRISYSARDRDGFQSNARTGNDVDTVDNASARGHLRFDNSDNFEFLLTGEYSRDRTFGVSRKIAPTGPFVSSLGFVPNPDPRIVNTNVDGFFDRDIAGATGRAEWTTRFGLITSITSFRDVSSHVVQDTVGVPLDSSFDALGRPRGFMSIDDTTEEYDAFVQELRLSSLPDSSRWHWIVGANYSRDDVARVSVRDRSLLGLTSKPKFDQGNITDAFAVFGQATYAVTDRLNLTAGVRYTRDEKDFSLAVTDESGGLANNFNPATELFSITASDNWDALTPRFAIDYSPVDDILLYASASRGFKSGGFQGFAPDARSAQISFDPEFVWNYETGIKSQWWDKRVQFNLTAFYMDFTDLQFRQRILTVPGDESSAVVIILNAADAEIKGVEVSGAVIPVTGLTLSASYSYLDTEVKNFLEDVIGIPSNVPDISGNRLAHAPRNAFTVAADYMTGLQNFGDLNVHLDYSYSGKIFFEVENPASGLEDTYGILDARVSFQKTGASWELSVWGKNLTDTLYRTTSASAAGGTVGTSRFGDPRTWGVGLTWWYQ